MPQAVEGEPNEVAIVIERSDEPGKGAHVGEEVDRVRVDDRPTSEPVRHEIRRHPHSASGDASVHEAPREGRLAGPSSPDELDDHDAGAMLPADGATSR